MLGLGSALVPLNELVEVKYIRGTWQRCHIRIEDKNQTPSQVFIFFFFKY